MTTVATPLSPTRSLSTPTEPVEHGAEHRTAQLATRAVHAGRDDLTALGVHVPPIDLSTTTPLPDIATGGAAYEHLATGARPKNTYSRAEVEAIIREVWPDDLEDEAVRIATRESNLIPTVRNYCCYGLFQIYYSVHRTWLAQMGVTSASQLYDPRVSATAAYALYQRSGSWAPWAL